MRDFDQSELISAYVDGELSADECRRVEQLLAENPGLRQLRDEFLVLRGALKSMPKATLDDAFADRVFEKIRAMQAESPAVTPVPIGIPPGAGEPESRLGEPSDARSNRAMWFGILALATAACMGGILLFWNPFGEGLEGPGTGTKGSGGIAQQLPTGRGSEASEKGASTPIDPNTMAMGPSQVSRLQLAVDLTVSPAGQRKRVVEFLLGKYGIRVDQNLKIDERLEKAVLKSRLIGDAQIQVRNGDEQVAEPVPAQDDVELIYVETSGIQLKSFSLDVQNQPEIVRFRLDLVIGLNDQDVFQHLHQGAERFAQTEPNRGYRLQFSRPLFSSPGLFAAASRGASLMPQLVPTPSQEPREALRKDGIKVPATSLLPPATVTESADAASDLANAEAPVQPPSRVLFIVRNLKRDLPRTNRE